MVSLLRFKKQAESGYLSWNFGDQIRLEHHLF